MIVGYVVWMVILEEGGADGVLVLVSYFGPGGPRQGSFFWGVLVLLISFSFSACRSYVFVGDVCMVS